MIESIARDCTDFLWSSGESVQLKGHNSLILLFVLYRIRSTGEDEDARPFLANNRHGQCSMLLPPSMAQITYKLVLHKEMIRHMSQALWDAMQCMQACHVRSSVIRLHYLYLEVRIVR